MEKDNKSIINSSEASLITKPDLAIILQASLAISEQDVPEKLAETLMQILMKESGADRGCLLVERNGQLVIGAEATAKDSLTVNIYSDLKNPDYNSIPETIILRARDKNENILINDVATDKEYTSDKYFLSAHPKSIACIPIQSEKKNIAVIYLENNLSVNSFNSDKIAVLKILATQATVSFVKLTLYNRLNLSKKRFQDIMDNSPAVIFAKFLDNRYIFVNRKFENLYKVSRDRVVNMTDYDIFPKELAESFIEKDKYILETKKPLTYEETIPTEDGTHTYVITKFPLWNSEEKLYAIGGIATDITNLRRVEESLRESQSRFSYVLAATQDAIYDWDMGSGRIWRNEQYERSFDGPNGPNLEWWRHNIHPDEFKDVAARLETAFSKHDQLWNQEYRFKKINDEYAYVIDRGFIIYDRHGKPVRMIGALMDITERKQFVDNLERSLALSKATLEASTDAIVAVSTDNKIVDYNKKFVDMCNIPDSVLATRDAGRTIAFVLDQLKDSEKFVSTNNELDNSPGSDSFDLLEFKDNRVFERYSKPQRIKAGIIGRVWSFRDITERKRTEEAEKKRSVKIIERLSELLKLNKLISTLHLQEKLNKIAEMDARVLEVDRLSICFFDDERTVLSSAATYSLSKKSYLGGVSFKRNDYPRFFQELNSSHIVDANDALEDPRTSELSPGYLIPNGIMSLLSIPIRTSEKVIGVILHEHVSQKRVWSYEEQAFAYSIADLITMAVEEENKAKIMNTLIESEQRFRLAIGQLPILFGVFDTNLHWTMAGGKILDSLGLKAKNLIGKTIFQTSNTIDIANHQAALGGESFVYEYKLGETFLQRFVEPLKNSSGTIVGVISMSMDITERKKAELEIKKLNDRLAQCVKERTEELATSKNVFHVLVENIKQYGIVMLDNNGKITTWNKGAEHIHGFSADDVIDKPMSLLYSEEDIKNHEPENNLKSAKENGHIESTGWRVRKDGSKFRANIIITAIYEQNGNLNGFTEITRDISESGQNKKE